MFVVARRNSSSGRELFVVVSTRGKTDQCGVHGDLAGTRQGPIRLH